MAKVIYRVVRGKLEVSVEGQQGPGCKDYTESVMKRFALKQEDVVDEELPEFFETEQEREFE